MEEKKKDLQTRRNQKGQQTSNTEKFRCLKEKKRKAMKRRI
jgi:hypothetical protein